MKILLSSFFFFVLVNFSIGQDFFKTINEVSISRDREETRSIVPGRYEVSEIKIAALKTYLQSEVSNEDKGKTLTILDPDGKKVAFSVFEVKMMEDGLSAKYPDIRTYRGYNPAKKYEKIHFGISTTGFYATVSKPGQQYSIDRYADKQDRYYISYYHKDHSDEGAMSQTCGTKNAEFKDENTSAAIRSFGDNIPLRTYRFALACTGEFGAFYGPGKEEVLGEMMKSVNRMNLVLENDFAIRLLLIADNDKLIWTDPATHPYTDGSSGGSLLGQNTGILASNVGIGNFDIGHVYTRGCSDTGGIAFIRSACAANKGGGVTCHYSNDITAMAIRVAAHEVGHQLGANHTFNNCSGNENITTAYEPGSGSTIMSYGGLCGSELNVVDVADDYYHVSSVIEVARYTRDLFGNSCATLIPTDNHIPDISIPLANGFSIPISTPFELTGEATDMNSDDLTYVWEQYNTGPQAVPGLPFGNSPLFVSDYPNPSPTRVFPKMSSIVSNNAEKTEVLPSYERDMNFQFIVRDNNPEAGGVAWEEIEFYTTESAGPFLVSYPDTSETFQVGDEIEVAWEVANTNNDIVNCQFVDILLSTDGGFTYDIELIGKTPNDGLEKIFVPLAVSDKARIKIKASDNVFFDISNANFSIEEPTIPGYLFTNSSSLVAGCVPEDIEINFTTTGFLDYDKPISFAISDTLPAGMQIEFSPSTVMPGESTLATIRFTDPSITGTQIFTVVTESEADTLSREIILDLLSTDFSAIAAVSPLPGQSGTVVSPYFTWIKDSDATNYTFMLSDNPSFDPEMSNILYMESVLDTFFELDDILDKSTVYFWTVIGENICGQSEITEIYTFGTEALSCNTYDYNDVPLGISQSGVITIEMPLEILGGGQVTDVNVLKIRGSHTWVSELKGELTSPSGLSVLLFNKKCGNQSNFNAGFDDDAVGGITCPLSQGIFYQPEQKLDTFRGEEIAGTWLFTLTDTKIGNGGTVQEYKLELCSNAVLDGPSIIVNEVMPLPSGVGRRLSSDFLLVEDGNNSNEELVYTLVRLPQNGTLRKQDELLLVGSQFTQQDIDQMNIRYQHDGVSTDDRFVFTLADGEGGWIDQTAFEILVDDNAVLDIDEVIIPAYDLFPNPGNGTFNVVFDEFHSEIDFVIYDVVGRKVGFTNKSDHGYQISINGAASGVYFVEINGEGFRDVRRIVVAK